LAEQLMDARKQATEAATELKATRLKIEHLEREIQTKSKQLKVNGHNLSTWLWPSVPLGSTPLKFTLELRR